MLSEAKHLSLFLTESIQKKSEILRFAQNDIGRWIVIFSKFIERRNECQSAQNTCTQI